MTRNGKIFIQVNNIEASFYILNTVTVQSLQGITMSQSTFHPEKLTVAQLLIQFLVFYRTCGVITISTTAWITPSQLTSSVHLSSVLTYIIHWKTSLLQHICLVHFKHHADTPKWQTKRSETLTNNRTTDWPNLLFLNWHKRQQTKTQTTNNINHNLNYIYYIATIKQKSQSSITNTTPKLSCLY